MSEPNLQDLLGPSSGRRRRRLDDETKRRRRDEQMNRGATVTNRTYQALRRLHPNDYKALHAQAVEMVNAERGPLPGDEVQP